MFPHHIQKQLVDAPVLTQFRMKSGGQEPALPNQRWRSLARSQDLHPGTHLLQPRSPDVHRLQRAAWQRGLLRADRRVILATIRVSFYNGIEKTEAQLRRLYLASKQDAPCTGTKYRFVLAEVMKGVIEAGPLEVLQKSSRLTTRDDQAIQAFQVVRLPDETRYSAELRQPLGMDGKCTLQRQDTNGGSMHTSIIGELSNQICGPVQHSPGTRPGLRFLPGNCLLPAARLHQVLLLDGRCRKTLHRSRDGLTGFRNNLRIGEMGCREHDCLGS